MAFERTGTAALRRARATVVVLAALAALTAACGGSTGHGSTTAAAVTHAAETSTAADNGLQLANSPEDCLTTTQRRRAVDRALADAAHMRRIAAPLDRSLMGTPALQQATDRFL